MLAASQIARRVLPIPDAAFAAIAFLSGTLDWLNPFHHDMAATDAIDEEFHIPEPGQFVHHL